MGRIYTSNYGGRKIGESISVSLYPPKGFREKHLPVFTPTKELLDWWKLSPQDTEAQAEYEHRFVSILE